MPAVVIVKLGRIAPHFLQDGSELTVSKSCAHALVGTMKPETNGVLS